MRQTSRSNLDLFSACGYAPSKVFEAPGVEPIFPKKDQAINYAQNRASFRSGEIRILDPSGNVERIIPFDEADRKL
jgi:hypothetical protein